MNRSIRFLMAAAAALIITGCASAPGDVLSTWRMFLKETPDVTLTERQIQRFPYHLQYVRIGDQPRVTMVLGFVDTVGGDRYFNWVSADKQTLVTLNGRAVSISRLGPFQIHAVTNKDRDPLVALAQQAQAEQMVGQRAEWERVVDFSRYGSNHMVTAQSSFEVIAEVDVTLPTETVKAFQIRERGLFVEYDQHFINEFWVEADGHVIQSRQVVAPGAPVLALTQVKWVGR